MIAGYSTQKSQILPLNNINIQHYNNWLHIDAFTRNLEGEKILLWVIIISYKCAQLQDLLGYIYQLLEYTNWLEVLKKYRLAIAWVFIVSILLYLTNVVIHKTIWIQSSSGNWCYVLPETTGLAYHWISILNVKLKVSHYWPGYLRAISTWTWLRFSALPTGRLYPQEIFLVLISVRDWVDSKLIVGRKDYVSQKFQGIHRKSNPQPSGLYVPQCLNQ